MTFSLSSRRAYQPDLGLAGTIALLFFVVIGILLRITDLSVPDFSTDEAQFAFGSRSHPFVAIALMQLFQALFGQSIPVVRSVSALSGIATLAVLFALMRQLYPEKKEAAVLTLALASLFSSHILLSRLAYLDVVQCLMWALVLFAYLRASARQTTQSITLLSIVAMLAIFVKVQGMLFPLLLLIGRFCEKRGKVLGDPVFAALFLSLIPFAFYVLSQPEVGAILFLYTGKVIGFIDLSGRFISLLTLWKSILGIFLILIPLSLPQLRRTPWPVTVLLLLAIGINFFLSPRLYYSTYLVFFAIPMGLLLASWKIPFRVITLCIVLFSTLLIAGPSAFPLSSYRYYLFQNPGYWNTHGAAINESIGDADSVIAIGHVGHQVRWYIDAKVLVGNEMDTAHMPGTFLVVAPPGLYTLENTEMLYSDERVQVYRR